MWADRTLRLTLSGHSRLIAVVSMTLEEALAYATRQQLDEPEAAVMLIERLAPVILGDLALLGHAISNAWKTGLSD
jgi:hypothetical protein